jgi:hypothetical protein
MGRGEAKTVGSSEAAEVLSRAVQVLGVIVKTTLLILNETWSQRIEGATDTDAFAGVHPRDSAEAQQWPMRL